MEVVAIANQKGGCGKTTTAVNLSACLAAKGRKVLLIDLDPQGSATTHLAIGNFDNTMYEAMLGDLSLSQLTMPTEIKGLDIIPADKRLGKAEMEIAGKSIARERILKPKIQTQTAYDFIIIDTPPTLGLITVNSLVAATNLIVPIQSSYFALEGTDDLLETFEKVRARSNPGLALLGVLITLYDRRIVIAKDSEEHIRKLFEDRVFKTIISKNVRLEESPAFKESIFTFAPNSRGAIEYQELAKEIIKNV